MKIQTIRRNCSNIHTFFSTKVICFLLCFKSESRHALYCWFWPNFCDMLVFLYRCSSLILWLLFKVSQTETYLDTLLENSFLPLITLPTRIGLNSVTILDHICTNFADDSFDSGIIVSDISDHFPGLYIRSFKDKFLEKKFQQKTRKFDSESIFKFKTFLKFFETRTMHLIIFLSRLLTILRVHSLKKM